MYTYMQNIFISADNFIFLNE